MGSESSNELLLPVGRPQVCSGARRFWRALSVRSKTEISNLTFLSEIIGTRAEKIICWVQETSHGSGVSLVGPREAAETSGWSESARYGVGREGSSKGDAADRSKQQR